MRLSGQFQAFFVVFFLRKSFKRTTRQVKTKLTNKTETSEQNTTKSTIFSAQKILRRRKVLILHFGAFFRLKMF